MIDVLLVYRVDRFSRNLRDMVTLLDELDEAGVVCRSATEPFDTSTPMGRMLVQMLGMFAQFERDTIIDRVIAGMERKAARGKWKGGKRPYGYQVDKANSILISDDNEATVVRLIFSLYTQDRLGSRAIAVILNDRGHRTTSGGPWSGYQVIRALSNRVYLGELTFRGTTVTGTHQPVITPATWDTAQDILADRGESHAHRASSGSDYILTGRLRCPQCGKAMIGTRANGRTATYRYYTCWTRSRYDATRCNFTRLNADAVDTAILQALATFYRTRHDLITDAITAAQGQYHAAHASRHAELAAISAELAKTAQATDRYLNAFEHGTLDPELLAGRLAQLRDKASQLRARHEELTRSLHHQPAAPQAATLTDIADHIAEVITNGTSNQAKALIEALVAEVTITGPSRLTPVFRIPQPASNQANGQATATHTAQTTPSKAVRAMTKSVVRLGLELRRSGREHPRLGRVQVIDVEVQVHLHRRRRVGPRWRLVPGRGLEIDPAAGAVDGGPAVANVGHLPAGDLGVEPGQFAGIAAVERDRAELDRVRHDAHDPSATYLSWCGIFASRRQPCQLPVTRLTGNGLQVGEDQVALLVSVDVLRGSQGLVGVLPGLAGLPGDRVRPGERLVGEGEIPVPDAVLLADVQHPAGVVQRRLGPPEHRVDPGDLPLAAGEMSRRRSGNLAPVIPRGVRRVDHSVIVRAGPLLLLHQPPGLVEELGGQQLDVGDAAGARRALRGRGGRFQLGHGVFDSFRE
jgi:site-specific DNA recombinase